MKLKISIKIDDDEAGMTEKTVKRVISDDHKEALGELLNVIIDTIPSEMFPAFDVLEIYRDGKRLGHAEK